MAGSIADHIESMTDYDFAHLLFSDGDVEQSISLDRQLNIIQVADLVLPDKDTKFEEYTTMELLSVAMLIVISTFALDFIHSDRSIFKMVDLDEAWTFLQVAQGKFLSYREDYLKKEELYSKQIEALEEKKKDNVTEDVFETPWLKRLLELKDIETLDRDIVVEMISEIKVYENRKIKITYNFGNELEHLFSSVYSVESEGKAI